MTVCIAAICDGGRRIVVCADRMFTAGPPINLEFETAEKKIEKLSASCAALFSGSSAFATEILQDALGRLAGAQQPPVVLAAEVVKDAYAKVRNAKIRETFIFPLL